MKWIDIKDTYKEINGLPVVGDLVFVEGSGIFQVTAIKKKTTVQVKDKQGYSFYLPPSFYKLIDVID